MKKLIEKFFGKKENAITVSSKVYPGRKARRLLFEPLENREMLSISWSAFNEIDKIFADLKGNANTYTAVFETAVLPFIGDTLGGTYDKGKEVISDAFGKLESAVQNVQFIVDSAKDVIGRAEDFASQLEGYLKSVAKDSIASVIPVQGSVIDTGLDFILGGSAKFEVHTQISKSIDIGIATNFGLPGLGMTIDSGSELVMEFIVGINFIIGYDDGTIYLDTSKDKEVSLSGTLKSNNVNINGILGVLEIGANLGTRDLLTVEYAIDLVAPGNRITLSTLGSLTATSSFKANTPEITVILNAQFTKNVGAVLGAFNPEVCADLVFGAWDSTKNGGFKVDLNDIKLMGFGNNFLSDFAGRLNTVIAPLVNVGNNLNKPLLGDSLFGAELKKQGIDTSVLGLLGKLPGSYGNSVKTIQQFFNTVDTISQFIDTVVSLPAGLSFGSISFGDAASSTSMPEYAEKDVKGKIEEQSKTDQSLKNFLSCTVSSGFGIKFDIYENPLNLLQLFTINSSSSLEAFEKLKFFTIEAHVSAAIEAKHTWTLFSFNAIDVGINLNAGVEIRGQLNLGYDGTGIYEYVNSKKPEKLLRGFYTDNIVDKNLPVIEIKGTAGNNNELVTFGLGANVSVVKLVGNVLGPLGAAGAAIVSKLFDVKGGIEGRVYINGGMQVYFQESRFDHISDLTKLAIEGGVNWGSSIVCGISGKLLCWDLFNKEWTILKITEQPLIRFSDGITYNNHDMTKLIDAGIPLDQTYWEDFAVGKGKEKRLVEIRAENTYLRVYLETGL